MRKSSLLCYLLIFCISSTRLMAQADSSVINGYASVENAVAENKLTDDAPPVAGGVRIVQNPVKDVLQLEGLDAAAKSMITISSSFGKIVHQSRSGGSGTYSANLGKMKPGIYFVTIKYKDNSVLLRFIKE